MREYHALERKRTQSLTRIGRLSVCLAHDTQPIALSLMIFRCGKNKNGNKDCAPWMFPAQKMHCSRP